MAAHIFVILSQHGFALLAFMSVVLSLIAFLPYIRDTFRGQTKPDRASWLIWTFLSCTAVMSLLYEGGGPAVWFMGVQAAMTAFIFVQSIWLGAGSYLSRSNLYIFAAATFGIALWYVLETSVYTLAIVILISALGAIPTVRKAARTPASETMSTWVISGVAAMCGAVSVGSLDLVQLAYPVYLVLLYCAIVWAMWMGLRAQQRVQSWSHEEFAPVPPRGAPAFVPVHVAALVPMRGKPFVAVSDMGGKIKIRRARGGAKRMSGYGGRQG